MKIYEISVGIEKFEIDSADVPRVLQAMQTNDIVMLKCGAFRGETIRSVVSRTTPDPVTYVPTVVEVCKRLQDEAAAKCEKCKGTRWTQEKRETETVACVCACQNVRDALKVEMEKVNKAQWDMRSRMVGLAEAKKI